MRKLLSILLALALCVESFATTEIINNTYNSTVGDGLGIAHDKAFLLFDLSSIPAGSTVTAASLVFRIHLAPSLANVTAAVKSSNANVAWNESTGFATLDGYTVSGTINSFTMLTTDTNDVTTYTVDVLGDGTKGIQEAWSLGTKATIVLTSGTLTAGTITASIVLSNSDNAILNGRTDSFPPVLTITYTAPASAAPRRMKRVAVNGGY